MNVSVHRVDYLDAADRLNLIRLMDEYARFDMGDGRPDVRSLPDQLHAFPTAFSVLAHADERSVEAVGLINCMFGFSTFMGKRLVNIHDVIVTESFRGQGVVAAMLSEVEQIAREADCCRLTLEVYEDNRSARRAYAKYGFTGDPAHPDVHTLFLRKTLS
jgi:ribosomal protein S18 acetylase RimI-like enzyme